MPKGMTEDETRRNLVDKALRDAGWDIIDFVQGRELGTVAVREYPTIGGPADYILFVHGEALATVEAKKVSLDPQNVLSQAKRYSRGYSDGKLNFGGYRIPFGFSTNGTKFWFQDLRDPHSRSRQTSGFRTSRALEELFHEESMSWKEWFDEHPASYPVLRPYQKEAIDATEQALSSGKRRMLLAMATGTGKTVVAVSEIHRLLKSGMVKRVLFLVDRRALAAQAVGAFASFEVQPGLKFDKEYEVYSQRFRREDLEDYKFDPKVIPTEYLVDPKPYNTFVYVCTIQRMRINLFGKEGMFRETYEEEETEDEAELLPIPIHAFDCIVADECHRGYTSTEEGKWRQVLDHFDAVKIGLTATPAAHTTAYFNDIVYRYDYERAVREGYLVDYDAVNISSNITMHGLFLKPGEEVKYVDTTTGKEIYDLLEDERAFDTTEIERKVTALDRNRKVVKEFAKYALNFEKEFGRFPKTLFFAVNDLPHVSHADQLVNLLRDEFGRGDSFVEKITGSPTVDRPLQRIREFRNRPEPAIAITVDMLTTGIDVPKIENLVFLRPVKSRILFAQMLGRGTRRCDEINKTHFTVFDCFDGTLLEYFRKTTDFTVDPPAKPTRSTHEIIECIYGNKDREYNLKVLIRRLQRIEKSVSSEGREDFERFIPDGDIGGFAENLADKLRNEWADTMKILRDPAFQDALEHYPRAVRDFIISETAEDKVSSEVLFRTTDGRELKPQDYLLSFEKFVRENPDHIDALSILLQRPASFHTKELSDLRKKLAARPERFTEENLRRAYQNELADIISIIKHAARGEPLASAQERVERAITKVKREKAFNPVQDRWLDMIRDHLLENIVIDERDFEMIPFSRHGGWEKANEVFDGRLIPLLREIDLEMVE